MVSPSKTRMWRPAGRQSPRRTRCGFRRPARAPGRLFSRRGMRCYLCSRPRKREPVRWDAPTSPRSLTSAVATGVSASCSVWTAAVVRSRTPSRHSSSPLRGLAGQESFFADTATFQIVLSRDSSDAGAATSQRRRGWLQRRGADTARTSRPAPPRPSVTLGMRDLVSAPHGGRLCTWLRSPAAQRSSWMRTRLPAGSRKAQSRMP